MTEVTQEIDTSGLNCPMPVIRAKKALEKLRTGDVVRVYSTDPSSVKDFEAFAKHSGNELLESSREGKTFVYTLKKT